jgi:putative oxidoreductase
MSDTTYIIRPLGAAYQMLEPLTLPFLRVVTGLWLVPHGWGKLMGGMGGTAEFLASVGFTPGWFWAWAIALTEVVGGLLLAAGLFTRPAAFAILVFMLNAVSFHAAKGFLWSNGGWEYPAMWAALALVFVIRGGGFLSVDRAIGREF